MERLERELREFCEEIPLRCLIDDLVVYDRDLKRLKGIVGEEVLPFEFYSPFVREKILSVLEKVLSSSGEGVVYAALGRYKGKGYYFLLVDRNPLSLVVSRKSAEKFLKKLEFLIPFLSESAREEIRGILSLLYFADKELAERVVEVEKKLEAGLEGHGQPSRSVLRPSVVKLDSELFFKRFNLVRLTDLTDFLSKVSRRLFGKENSVVVWWNR